MNTQTQIYYTKHTHTQTNGSMNERTNEDERNKP